MSAKRTARTKPRQAASPRSLDRYQRELHTIVANCDETITWLRVHVRGKAKRLLASMDRAEKR